MQLQFGRVTASSFNLDYSHPFNGLEAFAIAISALTAKSFGD